MTPHPSAPLAVALVLHPAPPLPVELTAARELARATGAAIVPATPSAARGLSLRVARRGDGLPPGAHADRAWIWLRLDTDGTGEITASHGSFLFTAVRLLLGGLGEDTHAKLAGGLLLPATFGWHRPHWDACYTQYWRSIRHFDPERYVAALAEAGFTHCEVNGLQAHMPYEDFVPFEYYPQFYTYAPGFNHFVETALTKGIWPAHYLDANLAHLVKLAELGRRHGLKPGVCMFEPRSLPERFFVKYPTLRGARIDHPFRSRLPRYTLAQDHPITLRHYREALQALIRAVPDLDYMSVWTNDSGAGFEHTSSLYVGRNGGPYLIREWRNHDKIAQAAGASIVRYLKNLREAAAELNPEFDVILRLEPFKMEHEHIKAGLGGHVTWEGPSLLVRGYSLPYSHPKYPENAGAAGSLFHTTMDAAEAPALAEGRARGINPVLQYSASGVMNHEPLLGVPYPRLLHAKLLALRDTGVDRISCLGGLTNPARAPYWPNPVAIQAAQFFPDRPIDEVLRDHAARLVGSAQADTLNAAWLDFEEALVWQPLVGLYCAFGFCWQRTWDRPFVPDIEAIPAAERDYYERHGCFQHNNPGVNDLGRDVLFDLITQEQGAKMTADMDRELLPRVRALLDHLGRVAGGLPAGGDARAVFVDLRDRVAGYLHWATSLRNVCSWCENVYAYLATTDEPTRRHHVERLQATIDLELENSHGLLELIETSDTEFMAVSGVANNTFFYGEDLPANLRRKIALMEKHRHHPPRIDRDILWRPNPGTAWPEGWSAR